MFLLLQTTNVNTNAIPLEWNWVLGIIVGLISILFGWITTGMKESINSNKLENVSLKSDFENTKKEFTAFQVSVSKEFFTKEEMREFKAEINVKFAELMTAIKDKQDKH